MGGVSPASPAEAFCPAFGWLKLGAAVDGATEPVAMLSDAAALALIADGEAFAATALLFDFSGNGLRPATAESGEGNCQRNGD
jgi:hypothetical protein